MTEELQHRFESIFSKVIDTEGGDVQLIQTPKPVYYSMADGFRFEYSFHFAINYRRGEYEYYLAFIYINSDDLVSHHTCKNWVFAIRYLPITVKVCLVTDKGFTPDALEYVRGNSFTIDDRLILAKYCGDDEQTLVLNRLWTDYSDPRGRTGVLTNEKPCAGAVLNMAFDAYSTIGILSALGIPIKDEYEFKCPYLSNEEIEERAMNVLNAIHITEREMSIEPDYLWRIADAEKLDIVFMDMGKEFFGEYSYAEKTIYLNIRERSKGPTVRERFTLAHELGHHFLHRYILEQYNYTPAEDQDSLNVVGASNDQIRYFECQANKFASYLLMPGNVLQKYAKEVMLHFDIRKDYVYDDGQYSQTEGAFNHRTATRFVENVASHFYVSKEAARYRLKELDLLREPYEVETRLFL
ncbi:MAG: ImmA/IrrE family metallo-endopeptidase [Paludibacteraceae bacterium]|nr:ImmA/IrrE family metallo-endopeptidase [Paludibacteraceae bacterium]